jgi:hypothetical protein
MISVLLRPSVSEERYEGVWNGHLLWRTPELAEKHPDGTIGLARLLGPLEAP